MALRLRKNRPDLLLNVEKSIWKAVFAIAEGTSTPLQALRALVINIPWVDLKAIQHLDICHWFELNLGRRWIERGTKGNASANHADNNGMSDGEQQVDDGNSIGDDIPMGEEEQEKDTEEREKGDTDRQNNDDVDMEEEEQGDTEREGDVAMEEEEQEQTGDKKGNTTEDEHSTGRRKSARQKQSSQRITDKSQSTMSQHLSSFMKRKPLRNHCHQPVVSKAEVNNNTIHVPANGTKGNPIDVDQYFSLWEPVGSLEFVC